MESSIRVGSGPGERFKREEGSAGQELATTSPGPAPVPKEVSFDSEPQNNQAQSAGSASHPHPSDSFDTAAPGDESWWSGEVAPKSSFHPDMTREQVGDVLLHGTVSIDEPIGGDHINETLLVTVTGKDGHQVRAVFKPADGQMDKFAFPIDASTQYRREEAISALAESFGLGDHVPVVKIRSVNGRVGSLMEYAEGTQSGAKIDAWEGDTLSRQEGEKLLFFDLITGAGDRKGSNMRVGKEPFPIKPGGPAPITDSTEPHPKPVRTYDASLIDLGIALPLNLEDAWISWPTNLVRSWNGPVLASTRKWLSGIDPRAMAHVLKEKGIEPQAAKVALKNLAFLKKDPDFVRFGDGFSSFENALNYHLRDFIAAQRAVLTPQEQAEMDAMVDQEYRQKPMPGQVPGAPTATSAKPGA